MAFFLFTLPKIYHTNSLQLRNEWKYVLIYKNKASFLNIKIGFPLRRIYSC